MVVGVVVVVMLFVVMVVMVVLVTPYLGIRYAIMSAIRLLTNIKSSSLYRCEPTRRVRGTDTHQV